MGAELECDAPWAAAGGAARGRGSEALDGAQQTPGEAVLRVLLVPDVDVGDAAEARRGVAAFASVVVGDGLAQLSNPNVFGPVLHFGQAGDSIVAEKSNFFRSYLFREAPREPQVP